MRGQFNTEAHKADAHGVGDGRPAGALSGYLSIFSRFPSARVLQEADYKLERSNGSHVLI